MGRIYDWFGLSVAHISQDMFASQRRAAYASDITYATANEVGFDFLMDGLARNETELVQRAFGYAVIDKADSILLDEARIPLVVAGGLPEDSGACHIDSIVARLCPHVHYSLDENARNVRLTDAGIQCVEAAGERAVETAGREMVPAINDDVWSDYLANVAEFAEPLQKFLKGELKIYEDFQRWVEEGIAGAFATASVRDGLIEFQGAERLERGATWTYVTTDQPFGTFTERVIRGVRAKFPK